MQSFPNAVLMENNGQHTDIHTPYRLVYGHLYRFNIGVLLYSFIHNDGISTETVSMHGWEYVQCLNILW